MTDIMLDLETLSTRADAAIIIIGAIRFYRKDKNVPMEEMDTFYRRVTVDSCVSAGLRVDDSTVEWWKQQEQISRYEALENPDRVSLKSALEDFTKWIGDNQRTVVWGNGADFDCTILGEAFLRLNMQIPWKFWCTRDCRTLFDLAGTRKSDLPAGLEHHALHDCYRQIIGVRRSLQTLGV